MFSILYNFINYLTDEKFILLNFNNFRDLCRVSDHSFFIWVKVTGQNPEASTGIEIETHRNVLPNFFIKGKIAKVSTGGKSFDGWQKFRRLAKVSTGGKSFDGGQKFRRM